LGLLIGCKSCILILFSLECLKLFFGNISLLAGVFVCESDSQSLSFLSLSVGSILGGLGSGEFVLSGGGSGLCSLKLSIGNVLNSFCFSLCTI
jgi:hypothetical protein